MPRLIPIRLAAVCALALVLLSLESPRSRSAKKVPAELRVVGTGGKVLAEENLRTGTTKVPTSPQGDLLRRGSRGSGRRQDDQGRDGARPARLGGAAGTRPCGRSTSPTPSASVSGSARSAARAPTSRLSWYLKVNHKASQVGGEATKLKPGDEVLWALASYPYPNELCLSGPNKATAGLPFAVTVYSYDEQGRRKPVRGRR